MKNLKIRKASESDKNRIIEISSKIWEGDDYIPYVVDEWIKSIDSEFVIAELEGQIAGFARYTRYSKDFGWLEGIRTDPEFRNLGIGKTLTDYLIKIAKKEGVKKLALSTYIDNEASIHIVESKEFIKFTSFVYCEKEIEQNDLVPYIDFSCIEKIQLNEALEFIEKSQFLAISKGFIPAGWKIYPFELVKGKFSEKIEHISGIRKEGKINSLICFSKIPYKPPGKSPEFDNYTLVLFLDGQPDEMNKLLNYVLASGKEHHFISAMIPRFQGREAKALQIFKSCEFKSWNNFNEDSFLYVKEL
jgi:N-acetylglutamate synthase-like GNAT family acetyltransferase